MGEAESTVPCSQFEKTTKIALGSYSKTCIVKVPLSWGEAEGAVPCSQFEKTTKISSLDPIQKRALSRSVQLEAVYFEALLYRGSPLSTIFGTWKKSYYAKFVLVESISASTIFIQSPPLVRISTNTNFYQSLPPPQALVYIETQ